MRLKRSIVFYVAFAVLAALFVILNVRARRSEPESKYALNYPFMLEDVLSAPIHRRLPFLVADVDRDGNDDLLINEPERLLWYRFDGKRMTLAGEGMYELPGITHMVADVDGDDRLEFFVVMKAPGGVMMSCYNWFSPDSSKAPAYSVGPLFHPIDEAQIPWRRMKFFGSFPTAKGGPPTILVGTNPLRIEDTKCSLHAFDGVTGRKLWRFDFGPQSLNLVCDSFGTDVPRIVLSTFSVGKGFSSNGTSDDTCYLFCLDQRDGSLLWKKRLGGSIERAHPAIADFDGDGRKEIFVIRRGPPKDPGFSKDASSWNAAILSPDGSILSSARFPVLKGSMCVASLDGDSIPEILLDTDDGEIVIVNHDLTIRKVVVPRPHESRLDSDLHGVLDLNGDERQEIACGNARSIVVRDLDGIVVAAREYSFEAFLQIARFHGKSYLAVSEGGRIHILALKRVPVTDKIIAQAKRLAIGIVGALLIVTLGAWAAFQFLGWRRDRLLTFDAEQSELLIAMAAFGHGGSSLKILDRLRLHLKNWERIRADGVTREELFARLHETYRETVVPEIKHIVILARRARVPESTWASLLAEAELASKEMAAILSSGSEGSATQGEHVAKALAVLDNADASIAGIRAHLRSVFRTPVAAALDRLIARFRYDHEGSGVSFVLACDQSEAATVFVSPVSFDKVFEALLSNAVRATEGKPGAEISVAIRWEGDYCRIDVRDNGCGIPRDDWERVFDRTYTTKTVGGGFGLYYAREELAKFGAKIYVLDSAAGSGTTMRAVLRKSEKAGGA